MTTRPLLKYGDVVQILVHDGQVFFGRYVGSTPDGSPLIEIRVSDCAEFKTSRVLFGPVMVGINPPVRSGRWKKVGSLSEPVLQPKFLSFMANNEGKPEVWWLIDGAKEVRLGKSVPKEYWDLELGVIYSADRIEERILNPEPVGRVRRILGQMDT